MCMMEIEKETKKKLTCSPDKPPALCIQTEPLCLSEEGGGNVYEFSEKPIHAPRVFPNASLCSFYLNAYTS